MLKELNKTFIIVIPKRKDTKVLNEFRPISLCNVAYKLISKIISNHIRGVIGKLIAHIQSTFILGRLIVVNRILAQDIVHLFSKKRGAKGLISIKLDM